MLENCLHFIRTNYSCFSIKAYTNSAFCSKVIPKSNSQQGLFFAHYVNFKVGMNLTVGTGTFVHEKYVPNFQAIFALSAVFLQQTTTTTIRRVKLLNRVIFFTTMKLEPPGLICHQKVRNIH